MFSQVSAKRVGVGISGPMSCLGVSVPGSMFLPSRSVGTHPQTWNTRPRPGHGTCQGGEYSPPLLTPSGGRQNMYGWHAGGTHPTGMLSLTSFFFVANSKRY